MRSRSRTSPTAMFSRYMLFGIPLCLLIGLVWPPGIIVCLLVLTAVWLIHVVGTNLIVRVFAPDYYRAIRQNGGNAFYDNLGAPLNFDSEAVRQQGLQPNCVCPECGNPMFVADNVQTQCSNCRLLWNNGWYGYVGNQWVPYNPGPTPNMGNTVPMEVRSPDM